MNVHTTFAQHHLHAIDSVMDMSPYYLPTSYTHINFLEFMPLKFKMIDTTMIVTHLFEPLLRTENIYQNLGIGGQAHQSIIFDYQREMGFLYQTLPYPLYFKKQSDLKYYKLKTTYSRVAYTLTFSKNNNIYAEFARHMRGVSVAANIYATFNEGTFVHQTTRNLCGDLLIHYELPSSIYGFRASYIINHLSNQENGGLLDINSFQKRELSNNAAYAARSTNASSLITTHDFALQNYWNVKDRQNRYFGTFTHDFQWTQTTIRYKDQFESPYPHFGTYFSDKITDDSTRIVTAKNALQWSNFSPFQEASNQSNFFHIAGGLLHDYADLKYANLPFSSLYLFARTHIRLFSAMDITGQVSYSVISDYANNDFVAKAGVSWAINREREKEHAVGLNVNYFRNSPEYMMQYVFTNHFRWINQFTEQNIVQFKTFWDYRKYNVSLSYYYLNKWVYLSEELRPTQSENDGNLIQLSAFVPFRHKNFGTTANLNVQYCTKNVINVPIFAGKVSVFYIIELLKKRLLIQIGTDLMYTTPYYADAYLPALHSFYYQRSQAVGNFLFMDANITFKIERVNFFFRIGNILSPMMGNRSSTTPNYPLNDYSISLGINWRFFD
ncbi:MAG: putative porin [Bacteroidetes bacterium]|nr:putative porin [Bacteroidota bacterium]MCL2303648.1 putative porin [Lentimicrobiaceae bacterium]